MPTKPLIPFADMLRDLQLLKPAQLKELRLLQGEHGESKDLARELMRRGWLTAFQANQLLRGHGCDLVLGQYVLLDRLGAGGMGEVFKGLHRRLDRIVAVKLIRKDRLTTPDAGRRFQQEARAAARLSHPNIVTIFDADELNGTHFLVMEYVEGTDLARLVQENGSLPVAQACAYVSQAALGLQHAHEQGLVHRDIKPANLLLAPKMGGIKILDLGLARLHRLTGGTTDALTQEGALMGTPDYLAPEQAVDAHKVDIRADIYSLGCTFYHLLTGQPPFPDGSLVQKLACHMQVEPFPVEKLRPAVSAELALVIRKMMAKRPEDRYRTPDKLATALLPFAQRTDTPVAELVDVVVAEVVPLARRVPPPLPSTATDGRAKTEKTLPSPAARKSRPVARKADAGSQPHRQSQGMRQSPPGGKGRGVSWIATGITLFLLLGGAAWAILAFLNSSVDKRAENTGSTAPGAGQPYPASNKSVVSIKERAEKIPAPTIDPFFPPAPNDIPQAMPMPAPKKMPGPNRESSDDPLAYVPADSSVIVGIDFGGLLNHPVLGAHVEQLFEKSTGGEPLLPGWKLATGLKARDLMDQLVLAITGSLEKLEKPEEVASMLTVVMKSRIPFDQKQIAEAAENVEEKSVQGRAYYKHKDSKHGYLFIPSDRIIVQSTLTKTQFEGIVVSGGTRRRLSVETADLARLTANSLAWTLLSVDAGMRQSLKAGLEKTEAITPALKNSLAGTRAAAFWASIEGNQVRFNLNLVCADSESAKGAATEVQKLSGLMGLLIASMVENQPAGVKFANELTQSVAFSSAGATARMTAEVSVQSLNVFIEDMQKQSKEKKDNKASKGDGGG